MLHWKMEILLLLKADFLKYVKVAVNGLVYFDSPLKYLLLMEQSLGNLSAQSFIIIAQFEHTWLEIDR